MQGSSNPSANIKQVGGEDLTLGQQVKADSIPVVIAIDQTTVKTQTVPAATDGLSAKNMNSSDDTLLPMYETAQEVKGTPGQVYGYFIYNPDAAAVAYVSFYNNTGAPTVGTTVPLFQLAIPPASAANLMFPHGVTFSLEIWAAATSVADTNAAPTTDLEATIWYK